MSLLSSIEAQDDLIQKLNAFKAKIDTQTGSDNDSPQRYDFASNLIKSLSESFKKRDWESIDSSYSEASNMHLPDDLRFEWMNLQASIHSAMQSAESTYLQKKLKESELLVKDVRDLCLTAQKSEDLNPLIIRCADSQPRTARSTSSKNSPIVERINYLTQGCLTTLNKWGRYLDFKNKGHLEEANQALDSLKNASHYPVLTKDDIQKRQSKQDGLIDFLISREPVGELALREYIYKDITKITDITIALERVSKLKSVPYNDQIIREFDTLTSLQNSWQLTNGGNSSAALSFLYNSRQRSIVNNPSPELSRLINLVTTAAVNKQIAEISSIEASTDEQADVVMKRACQKLLEAGDLPKLEAVTRLYARYFKNDDSAQWPPVHQYIAYYINAERFEAAGDLISAVNLYRQVVAAASVDFIPVQRAIKALERIKQSHPEILTDSNAAIMAELSSIQNRLTKSPLQGPQNSVFPIPVHLPPSSP